MPEWRKDCSHIPFSCHNSLKFHSNYLIVVQFYKCWFSGKSRRCYHQAWIAILTPQAFIRSNGRTSCLVSSAVTKEAKETQVAKENWHTTSHPHLDTLNKGKSCIIVENVSQREHSTSSRVYPVLSEGVFSSRSWTNGRNWAWRRGGERDRGCMDFRLCEQALNATCWDGLLFRALGGKLFLQITCSSLFLWSFVCRYS